MMARVAARGTGRRLVAVLASLFLLGMAGPGKADSLSGAELLALCETPKSNDLIYFTNF